jgi:hypothetical protein
MSRIRTRLRRVPFLRTVVRRVDRSLHGPPPPPPPKPVKPPPPPPPPVPGVRELLHVAPRPSTVEGVRLNLVVSSVAAASTFGGVQTAIDLFLAVASDAPRRRIISVEPLDAAVLDYLPGFRCVTAADDTDDPAQLVSISAIEAGTLPVGPNDVFIATFWPTAALVLDFRRWQTATFGRAPSWFAYLIQDFEPAFYPASAQSMLARATYDAVPSTLAIYNTALLQDYFHGAGISFPVEFAFEPRLSPALRQALGQPAVERTRQILVYGRPGKPRNAFPLIVDGLRAWRAAYPDAASWSVVSAGEVHPLVDLGGGVAMRSLGKLDLSAYGELLRTSAIGVSLMVSPHPSYPPLEMAELGMLVLTNRFDAKDLSTWHTNITSLETISVERFAHDLIALCRRFEADPTIGAEGRLLRPDYLDDGPQFPFAKEVAGLLTGS